jgi:hypothetical protein
VYAFQQLAGTAGIRATEGISVETQRTDKWEAQLSQECPPPINAPANWNKQPHGTMSIGCGRLFRLGLAVQVVSGRAKSFHARIQIFFHFSILPRWLFRALATISCRQKRSTSAVFRSDSPFQES